MGTSCVNMIKATITLIWRPADEPDVLLSGVSSIQMVLHIFNRAKRIYRNSFKIIVKNKFDLFSIAVKKPNYWFFLFYYPIHVLLLMRTAVPFSYKRPFFIKLFYYADFLLFLDITSNYNVIIFRKRKLSFIYNRAAILLQFPSWILILNWPLIALHSSLFQAIGLLQNAGWTSESFLSPMWFQWFFFLIANPDK